MSAVIETNNLTKRYREKLAVNALTLAIQEGEVFGFLGPNGAGKTTTILMLLGLTEPTSGQASVCGFDPLHEPLEVKKRVGYLPENPGFYEDLSARENLLYMARLNRIPEDEARRRTAEVLDQVELSDDGRRLVREFSRGMKQRLGIAEVLIKDPRAVILDEPTLGIDPDGAIRILEMIKSLNRDHNLTVMLSSHQLQQVQEICSRVGIIVKGRLIVQGQMDELGRAILKERQWNFLLEVGAGASGLENDLGAINGVDEIERRAHGLFLRCTRDVRAEVMALLTRKNLPLLQLRSEDPTLEEIYLKYFREA
ncbi:MAG: ABC transporter ATP-binding protein [Deltaproteobacteria bacterium]|nr:ABC transporter ATP-binding protein [Deltaproteobacteria bacterium]MBI2181009.1 ABC transporter ATP-binding protein [Deltaproteobacteria bacterium]MBI2231199.1 ABC transporter ATP-binding protein [Deltaproteobacteria bacterium]MBI3066717.1 ABC transporter ATP-binding protein [Deltaproteobacteria bacterium]